MKIFSILTLTISIVSISTNIAFSQISNNTFKGAIDNKSPIFEIQKSDAADQVSAKVGDIILTRTAKFKNLKPDSNLGKVAALKFEVLITSIDNQELIIETHTYSPDAPDNILPWKHKIPLPLEEETIIELELYPTMKNYWKKLRSVAKIFPTMELNISSVENGEVTANIVKGFVTWGFGRDAHSNTLIIKKNKKKNHNIYSIPGYTIELMN